MPTKTRVYDPMRPTSLKKGEQWDFSRPGWGYQIKYDGFRGLLYKNGDACRFESKEGNDLSRMRGMFKDLCARVAQELRARDIVLDGEVAVLDERGRADFWALMEAKRPPVYVVFDILRIEGEDVRHLPLKERLMLLSGQVPRQSGTLLTASMIEDGLDAARIFAALSRPEMDVEGLVAKKLDSPYDPRLKSAWCKVLNPDYSHRKGKQEFFGKARKADTARH